MKLSRTSFRPDSRAAYFIAGATASRRLQIAIRFFERHAWQRPRHAGFGTQARPNSLA
jgi:hypothetical protein